MDLELRLAALSKLVDTKSEAVDRRLADEFKRAEETLLRSSRYDELSIALRTLAVLSPRFHMALMPMLDSFVQSMPSRNLVRGDSPTYRSTLLSLAMEAAKQVRYIHTEHFLDFMFELSRDTDAEVRRKADQALDEISEFDIDVFYERRQGAAPQARVVAHLAEMADPSLAAIADSALRVLGKVLSPTMEGHSWTYSSMTIRRGGIVSDGGVSEMREKAISLLKRMYTLKESVEFRQRVLRTMDIATRRERPADTSDTSKMFDRDAVSILEFRRALVKTEALPVVQTLEHQTYWDYYHAASKDIELKALEVRDELASHAEYQIYKQLIGFEGIFGAWEELRRSETAWDYGDTKRHEAARRFIEEIGSENSNLWLNRILEFSKTQSNDLATFPVYYEFLESLGRERPNLALELVTQHIDTMSPFLIVLLRGLWTSSQSSEIESIAGNWIAGGENLAAIAKSLYKVGTSRLDILDATISRSIEVDDRSALLEAMGVAASLYADGSERAKLAFMRALRELTKHRDARWASVVWFSSSFRTLVGAMTPDERAETLASLMSLQELDYQAEEILSVIAENDVESVLAYLVDRLKHARSRSHLDDGVDAFTGDRFQAIPYQFHKLDKLLARIPEKLLSTLRREFNAESRGLFTYREARLIEATFQEFTEPLQKVLLKYVESGDNEDIEFVLSILRAYDGPREILEVCRAIIKSVPEQSKAWNEVAAAIESTGVVSGEYGLVNAYEQKRSDISAWLKDDDALVRAFAQWLIKGLEDTIDREKKRADEDIALRKYKYGTGADER